MEIQISRTTKLKFSKDTKEGIYVTRYTSDGYVHQILNLYPVEWYSVPCDVCKKRIEASTKCWTYGYQPPYPFFICLDCYNKINLILDLQK